MLETKTPVQDEFTLEQHRIQAIIDTAGAAKDDLKAPSKDRSPVIYLILILALTLVTSMLFDVRQRYETDTMALDYRIKVVLDAKSAAQAALKNAVRRTRDYKASFLRENERARMLAAQVAQLMDIEAQSNKALEARDAQINALKSQNGSLKDTSARLSDEKSGLEAQVAVFQKTQENLQKKIKRLLIRPKVELGKIVITPAVLEGKIVKANRKYNFVIIDLGRNDGIKTGMRLVSSRGEMPAGDIVIEKVYDELSVGKADFAWAGNEVDVGDSVKTK